MPGTLPLLDPVLEDRLRSKYNLLDTINLMEYDHDMGQLAARLISQKKSVFLPTDRFVIVHFDVDFYFHGHGITINNLFNLWKQLDLPMYTMIVYTNHLGIDKEISYICKNQDQDDLPTVIESIVDPVNYCRTQYTDLDLNIDDIKLHYVCMMNGTPRSHRKATYHHLKHLIGNNIAMSIKKSA
jgi:hypothetical protein